MLHTKRCHQTWSPASNPQLRRKRLRLTQCTQPSTQPAPSTIHLVDAILNAVKNTDGGNDLAAEQRQKVNSQLAELESVGKRQQPRPLVNPLIFGNYNVAYTAAPGRGDPAGGTFRSKLGRTLFQTTGVYQSVLQPDLVVNKVSFKLFGLIPGYVGLRGKLTAVGEDQDTVRVFFEPPVVSFGKLTFTLGPPSQVVLATTYLDEQVRIGKGGSGSLFVFTRGGESDLAEMDQLGQEERLRVPPVVVGAGLVAVLAMCWAACQTGIFAVQGMAAAVALLATAVAFIIIRGGIQDDEPRLGSKGEPAMQPASQLSSS